VAPAPLAVRASLWINHNLPQSLAQKHAPAYYD